MSRMHDTQGELFQDILEYGLNSNYKNKAVILTPPSPLISEIKVQPYNLKTHVTQLVVQELAFANTKFPLFTSPHEAYAVLKEECDEVADEEVLMDASIAQLWLSTKLNKPVDCAISVHRLYDTAIRMAQVAIQVAAMCEKYYMHPKE